MSEVELIMFENSIEEEAQSAIKWIQAKVSQNTKSKIALSLHIHVCDFTVSQSQ